MKNSIAIVITTYKRPDGQTKFLLDRNLTSLKNQTSKDFKVFLIGDKYEDVEEFNSFSTYFNEMYMENLPYAKEREQYLNNYNLWCSGGVNATNVGIEKSLSEDFKWVICMDHDDYFLPTHIEDINNMINLDESSVFVCSKSKHNNQQIIPNCNSKYYTPKGGDLIKSSACVNFSKINIRFRDVYLETNKPYPSDADFWDRLSSVINHNNYVSFCTNNVTCIHDEEGYTMTLKNLRN